MDNLTIYTIIIAILQGVAEFLPVSSSGHLALAGALFGLSENENLTLGILLHAGSLAAICIFYFRTLLGFFRRDQFHLGMMVIVGTIPAGIAGVALKISGLAESLFDFPALVGFCFLITATILRMTDKEKLIVKNTPDAPPTPLKEISLRQALIVGFTQAFAILPGISRSGSTISAGILCGIEREAAGNFSFLLALPAIGGAVLLELIKFIRDAGGTPSQEELPFSLLVLGFVVSAVVSFFSLALLMKLIRKGKLVWFSWYLYIVGIAVIIWQIAKI